MTAWLALAWLLTGCVLNVWQVRLHLRRYGLPLACERLPMAVLCTVMLLAGPIVLGFIAGGAALVRRDRIPGDN